MKEAFASADQVIEGIKRSGGPDYTPFREQIADVFWNTLFDGNWDAQAHFGEVSRVPDLRFIQEDEYDQHMDDDEKPAEADEIGLLAGHYVSYVR